jgi:IS4 transposase
MSEVATQVKHLFNADYLEALARSSGFLKRKRKIETKAFLEHLIVLTLSSKQASLEELAYEFGRENCAVSKQALHKKFTSETSHFMKLVLEDLLKNTVQNPRMMLSDIPFVREVQVIDSSEIRLNDRLRRDFPHTRKGAAVKLQALVDMINSRIVSLDVRPAKEPDQGYQYPVAKAQANDLFIGDLGYFSLESFEKIAAQKSFYLSRYFKCTRIYSPDSGNRIDLPQLLKRSHHDLVELNVSLGSKQLKCRLVALRLTPEAYSQRLKQIHKKQGTHSSSSEKSSDILNQWTLLITNLPEVIDGQKLLKLYRARWQIELFFKALKSHLHLRKVDKTNPHRAMVAIYISLIAMVILSYILQTITHKEMSLYKATRLFALHIREFLVYIHSKKACAIQWMRSVLSRYALKESRQHRPSTRRTLHWSAIYA